MNNHLDNVETLILEKKKFDTSSNLEMNLNHNAFNLQIISTNQA